MSHNLAPCSVKDIVSFTKTNSSATGEEFTRGGIFPGSKYAWLSRGPFLKIVNIRSGERVSSWKFGSKHPEFYTSVTCVTGLQSTDFPGSLKLIVVGLECEVIGGMLCVFDILGSRLLRAIRLPGKVLCMSIVDTGSSGCEGRYPLPGLLSSMSGIIAVGVSEGRVFLVDLCRVTCEELLNTWFNDDREIVRDEEDPCQPILITMDDEDDSDVLEKKRTEAAVSGNHLCLLLNEDSFVKEEFILHSHKERTYISFRKMNVGVTAITYIPRTASLAVGFNFGCFQIWSLMHLHVNYTSYLMRNPLPVVHLGFQEPTDDPCNFCYLWAVHSSTADYPSSSPPFGLLYGLVYDSKEWVDGYGYLYQDYQSCHQRFEYSMTTDSHLHVDTRCVSFHTLSNSTQTQKNIAEAGYEEGSTENDLSLSVFMWEAYDHDGEPVASFMSLFDINQWYKAQMPSNIEAKKEDEKGYLVKFCLNFLREKPSQPDKPQNVILDLLIDPFELSQFRGLQPQEEHYYPSALSFASTVLLDSMLVRLSHPGLQRHLLQSMELEGAQSLLCPTELFKECLTVGLRPILLECNAHPEVPIEEQRDYLLSVALENQMMTFLYTCASDWANGSWGAFGCSLPLLLNWGFQRALGLKEAADNLCVPLFDHSGIRLDKNELILLENCTSQLRRLASLFQGILRDYKLSSLLEFENFQQRTEELTMVATYFEVLPWFINGGLLPEVPESDDTSTALPSRVPYPVTKLTKFYKERRHVLKTLNEQKGTNACLFIDKMLENESGSVNLASVWKNDGGSGLYPPPSIQSLLAMYLVKEIDVQTKHSMIIYLFLDLANYLDNRVFGKVIDHYIKFPCAFCINTSVIKVTQALWLLDQTRFEDALYMLLDPLISPKDLLPWHHRYIVHVLLCQGEHSKALEYCIVRKLPVQDMEDIKLKLSLLVVNEQITQAYTFLQQYHSEENNKELLFHFFQECAKIQQLGTVMKLMLSPAEEELFMSFLQNSNIKQSDDMQVTYYLMRARIVEARAVNERINSNALGKARMINSRKSIHKERSVRDLLVEGFTKTLPSITRDLASYCAEQKKSLQNWRQVQRPTPMSVDVHYGNGQSVRYKSSLIRATMEKARETWIIPEVPVLRSEVGRKDDLDASAVQNLPFLCTSVDKSMHERDSTPITFPRLTNSAGKRPLEADDEDMPLKRSRLDNDEGAPLKRSRLDITSSSLLSRQLRNKSFRRSSVRTPARSLLWSPLVKRITPLRREIERRESAERSFDQSLAGRLTPHSILKVRSSRSSVSPSSEHDVSVPRSASRGTTPSKTSDDTKQIRFCLPEQEEIEQAVPLSFSTPENVQERIKKNFVGHVKPRVSLRDSLAVKSPLAVIMEKDSSAVDSDRKLSREPNDVFIFGSASTPIACDSVKEADSTESFHSAEESVLKSSGSSEDSRMHKYIAGIKQVKARPQLPRLHDTPLKDEMVQRERSVSDVESVSSTSEEEMSVDEKKDILVDTSDAEITWFEKSRISLAVGRKPSLSDDEDDDDSETNAVGVLSEKKLSAVAKIQKIKGRKPLPRLLDSSYSSNDSSRNNSFSVCHKSNILVDDSDIELTGVIPLGETERKLVENDTFVEVEDSEEEMETRAKERRSGREHALKTGTGDVAMYHKFSEKREIYRSVKESLKGSGYSATTDIFCVETVTKEAVNAVEEASTGLDDEEDEIVLEEKKCDLGERTHASLTNLPSNQSSDYSEHQQPQEQHPQEQQRSEDTQYQHTLLKQEELRKRQQQLQEEQKKQELVELQRQQQLKEEQEKQELLERKRQQQLKEEQEKQELAERKRQQQLKEEWEKQELLERKRQQQLKEEWEKQELLERKRQQQLIEEQEKREWAEHLHQQQLKEEQEKQELAERQQQLRAEQEKQELAERQYQQQLKEEQEKQELLERKRQQQLKEEQEKQELLERKRQQQLKEEQEKQELLERKRQQQLRAEQEKQELAERQYQQQLKEEQEKQELLERKRQQQLKEEQEKQELLERKRQQQLKEEQEKQELLERKRQQQLIEEQEKQELLERKHQQQLKEEQEKQELLERKRQQQLKEEQEKQELLERKRQQQLKEEQEKQELLERKRQQQLKEEQEKRELAERQQQLRAEQEKQELAERQYQQQLKEEQEKRELVERERQQQLKEEQEKQELLERERQQQLKEEQEKQELLERKRQQQLKEEQEKQELAERQRQQQLKEEQEKQELEECQHQQQLKEEQEEQELLERQRQEHLQEEQEKRKLLAQQQHQQQLQDDLQQQLQDDLQQQLQDDLQQQLQEQQQQFLEQEQLNEFLPKQDQQLQVMESCSNADFPNEQETVTEFLRSDQVVFHLSGTVFETRQQELSQSNTTGKEDIQLAHSNARREELTVVPQESRENPSCHQDFNRSMKSQHALSHVPEETLQASMPSQQSSLPDAGMTQSKPPLPVKGADPATINISSDDSEEEKCEDDGDDIKIEVDNSVPQTLQRTPYSVEVEDVSSGSSSTTSVGSSSSREVIAINSDSDVDAKRSVIAEDQNAERMKIVDHDTSSNSVTVIENSMSGDEDESSSEKLVLRLPSSDESNSCNADGVVSKFSSNNTEDVPSVSAVKDPQNDKDDKLAQAVKSVTEEYHKIETENVADVFDPGEMETHPEVIITGAERETESYQKTEGQRSEVATSGGLPEEPMDAEGSNGTDRQVYTGETPSETHGLSSGRRSRQSVQESVDAGDSNDVDMSRKVSARETRDESQERIPVRRSRRSSRGLVVAEDSNDAKVCARETRGKSQEQSCGERSRQSSRSKSLQGEAPQMEEVSDSPLFVSKSKMRKSASLQGDELQNNDVAFSPLFDSKPKMHKRTSLQGKDNSDSPVFLSKPRTRRKTRASSVQSEPPELKDVVMPQVGRGTRQRTKASSLQGEPPQMTDFLRNSEQSPGRRSLQSRRAVSLRKEDSVSRADAQLSGPSHRAESFIQTRNRSKANSESPQKGDLQALESSPKASRGTRAGSVESEPGKNSRWLRSSSKVVDVLRRRGTSRTNQRNLDSDADSTQSEPPLLRDVQMGGRRRTVPRKPSVRNCSLKVPDLSSVLEEPNEDSQTDRVNVNAPTSIQKRPVRILRNRSISESQASQASALHLPDGRRRPSSDRGSSPRNKRKRSASLSSPEEPPKRRQYSESSVQGKEPRNAFGESIQQYTMARRVTRHQKSLMERSMSSTSVINHELHDRQLTSEDSSGEAEASVQILRSSSRLRSRRSSHQSGSPTHSSPRSTPQKRARKARSSATRSPTGSEISPSHSPAASSSKFASLQSIASETSKVERFRKAHAFLRSSVSLPNRTPSSSDAGSLVEAEDGIPIVFGDRAGVQVETVSDLESLKSHASGQSSVKSPSSSQSSRSTRCAITKAAKLRDEASHLTPINEEPSKEGSSREGESSSRAAAPPNQPSVTTNLFSSTAHESRDSQKTGRRKFSAYRKRTTLELKVRSRHSKNP